MSMIKKVEKQIAGRVLSIETGKLAKQASGAVLVCYGETVVFATVVSAAPREGMDYFPLFVDYREKLSAAGKFPGGFIKREGRPTLKEILTMRMIDRPIRPLFPKGFRNEVQIQTMVWSADQQNDPDILAMIGASAAVAISDIPFDGPIGAVRVGRIDGKFIINPTLEELSRSELDLLLGGVKEGVNMIEVGANELPEAVVAEAIEFGHKTIVEICEMVEELAADCGKEKFPFDEIDLGDLPERLEQSLGDRYRQARLEPVKQQRMQAIKALFEEFIPEVCPAEGEGDYSPEQVRAAIEEFQERLDRAEILAGRRADGRGYDELRPLSGEVAVLPRTHGSAIFIRGETQAIVTATLGTSDDAQTIDGLFEEYNKKFMLHYNFPPFCVGETGRLGPPSRREIGHGTLAERSIQQVIPSQDQFPYTIKLVCDILESNGSSSMATVCGGTLSLMDAGVPIRHPVAGISIGMVSDADRHILLTDIIGDEDHFGDMDFKVAGTQKGITGIQLDLKRRFLPFDIIRETFERAQKARLQILQMMLSVIDKPRQNISTYAPKLVITKVPEDMIGKIIGPGGSQVRRLQEMTGATIEIEDDGTVYVSCQGGDGHLKALEMIEAMTRPTQIGRVYHGKVVSVKDFGAFIEIAPGREGMCHISELADHYVRAVADVCKVGDELDVKVIAIDEQGRVKLSRKAAIQAERKATAEAGSDS
ncbi:MAG: polyribonucleotide nucleotidyltransferase [Sedimentisphaerales bacterium]|nr:polyribonucleotide nucleotidyltransferase [Sedimentisphaerales bacterium]